MSGHYSRFFRRSVPGGIVLALVLSVLGMSPAQAAPAAPGKLSPKNTSVAGHPILKWSRVRGAATYNVEISTGSGFTKVLDDDETTNRWYVPTDQLPAGKIWWRVQGVSTRGQTGRWATASFTRKQPSGPGLVSPASGTVLNQPANPPLLRWNPVNGATSYEVEIDTAERDWVETTTYDTQTTSLVVPDPQVAGKYWWRVRARLGDSLTSKPSTYRLYEVGPLPKVSDEATPDSGVEVQDVVFDWKPVSGAISYEIRVSTDDSFNKIIDQRAVKGTRYSPVSTYDNTNYWWQVRALNIFGMAQEWDEVKVREFRRAWSDPGFNLVYPQNRAVVSDGNGFYFQWTPSHLASHYRLDVGSDPTFSDQRLFDTCYTRQTSYAAGYVNQPVDKCMPASGGATTYWRVQPLDNSRNPINGVMSEVRMLQYSPGNVTQLSPADGATVDVPTLSWAPMKDTVKYLVRIIGGGRTREFTTHSYSFTPTGSSKLPAGDYTWTVQAVDQNGSESVIPNTGWRFKISGTLPSGSTPLAPTSSPTSSPRFPVLTWTPYAGADYYKIRITEAGFNFYAELADKFPFPAGTDTGTTYLRPGTYQWYVEAWDGSTKIADGSGLPKGTFTITDLQAVSGHQIALDATGLENGKVCKLTLCPDTRATPILDWDSVPDAGLYMVYLSYDNKLTNLVYGNKADPKTIPWTQNTRWNPLAALAESQAGDAYYWYIRPCKAIGACAPEPTDAKFAFQKKSLQVIPKAIKDISDGKVANEVTFSWEDYLDTNQAATNPKSGEAITQAAQSYHLQVATNPAFSNPVDDVVVDQTTYTAFSRTYPEGTLYWRVQAVDGSGNGLTWPEVTTTSTAWKFVKQSPRPTLTSPASGSTVNGTQPLSWKPLNFAANYEVEVYANGDTNASSRNRVVYAKSQQAAYSPREPLPVSGKPYVWRVRRLDADKRPGAWSAWSSFKVTGKAPALVSPKSGVRASRKDSLFTWKPVPGAAVYLFERKKSGYSTEERVATVGTAWAPTEILDRGAWLWRVIAYDSEGEPIKASGWRKFRA